MKRFFTLLVTLSLLCTSMGFVYAQNAAKPLAQEDASVDAQAFVFDDIAENFWGRADVEWAYENGITAGVEENLFDPDSPVTRAQFVSFLARMAQLMGITVEFTSNDYPFADVLPFVYYGLPANWAFEQGIVSGAGQNEQGQELFMPEENITRQEMAAMVSRMLHGLFDVETGAFGSLLYPDADEIASWALGYAPVMQYTGIILGHDDGSFDPEGLTSRAQAVAVIHRLYNLVVPQSLTDRDGNDYDGTSRSRVFRLDYLETYETSPNGILTLEGSDAANVCNETYIGGRFTVTAALGENGQILLQSPQAAEEFQSFDLGAYTPKDGEMHTYDLIWLDNNMYVFFVDGNEVHRVGDEYLAPTAENAPASLLLAGDIRVDKSIIYRYVDQSPFALHGALSVDDAFLIDAQGDRYMLNGLHLFNGGGEVEYACYETMKWLRDDWGIDGIRLASVLDEYGAHTNGIVAGSPEVREKMMQNIYDAVEVATQLNMYIIIDWHGLDESERYDKQPAPDGSTFSRADPLIYLPEAIDFFEEFSAAFADHDNVIYELYNEPLSGKDLYPDDFEAAYTYAWDRIKTQADALIPIIRENDPNAVIFVGTPSADQQLGYATNDLEFRNKYNNILYTVHYYANMESVKDQLVNNYNAGLPIFCSEFGIMESNEENDAYFDDYLALLQQYKVGNMFFMMARGDASAERTFCVLKNDVTALSNWTEEDLTYIGTKMRQFYRTCAGLE